MAKALWHISATRSALREVVTAAEEPPVIVKSRYSLVSTGTEHLVATGKVPVSLHESMQVPNMKGSFAFPLIYGYSLVGEIQQPDYLSGKMVHLLHPHQTECRVMPEEIFVIPEEVPAKRATLASNLETALTAIWDANVQIGDRVLIVGFGMIGALIGRLLTMLPSIDLTAIEPDEYRQRFAGQMGCQIVTTTVQNNFFDLAFHTSGTSQGLQQAIDSVGREGTVVELSWYGTHTTSLSLGAGFHRFRKRLISSQVGHIPAAKTARWNIRRRKEVVFDLLKRGCFDEHISHEIPFEEGPAFFQKLRNGGLPPGVGWCFCY